MAARKAAAAAAAAAMSGGDWCVGVDGLGFFGWNWAFWGWTSGGEE